MVEQNEEESVSERGKRKEREEEGIGDGGARSQKKDVVEDENDSFVADSGHKNASFFSFRERQGLERCVMQTHASRNGVSNDLPRQNVVDEDELEEEATAAPRIAAAAEAAEAKPEPDPSAADEDSLQAAASMRPPRVARPRRSILWRVLKREEENASAPFAFFWLEEK